MVGWALDTAGIKAILMGQLVLTALPLWGKDKPVLMINVLSTRQDLRISHHNNPPLRINIAGGDVKLDALNPKRQQRDGSLQVVLTSKIGTLFTAGHVVLKVDGRLVADDAAGEEGKIGVTEGGAKIG